MGITLGRLFCHLGFHHTDDETIHMGGKLYITIHHICKRRGCYYQQGVSRG